MIRKGYRYFGIMVCETCKGSGWIDHPLNDNYLTKCQTCWGKREFDWIDNILGVSYNDVYWFHGQGGPLLLKRKDVRDVMVQVNIK